MWRAAATRPMQLAGAGGGSPTYQTAPLLNHVGRYCMCESNYCKEIHLHSYNASCWTKRM